MSEAGPQPLRVLFFLRAIHYGRAFENLLRALLGRGHSVHVALAVDKRRHGPGSDQLFRELAETFPGFSFDPLAKRDGIWEPVAQALRTSHDYLRYLEPEYADAEPLRARVREVTPRLVRAVLAFPLRGRLGRWLLGALLRRLEAAMPIPKDLARVMDDRQPDVVIVAPLVTLGSFEGDYLRVAHAAGVPTVFVVASWDNLSNKGILRDGPGLTVVWNHTQVDEAVRLHGLPRDSVVAVGAHTFDHWFGWAASTTREDFCRARRLDPQRPLIVYLGSTSFVAGQEAAFVREWLDRLEQYPRLRDAAVLLRPHPYNAGGWGQIEDQPGRTTVWPRSVVHPETLATKQEYFDTLHHADVVVGINTSGLIEASILRKPVLTMLSDYFPTQEGTLHFAYIAHDGDGGVVTVGRNWREHLSQLADACDSPAAYGDRIERFLVDFVRPHGLGVPAAPLACAEIERAAGLRLPAKRRAPLLRIVIMMLTPVMWLLLRLCHPVRTWHHLVKASRRLAKRLRRRGRWVARRLWARRKRIKRRLTLWTKAFRKAKDRRPTSKARRRATSTREPARVQTPREHAVKSQTSSDDLASQSLPRRRPRDRVTLESTS